MSDEFLKIATKELIKDLMAISEILGSCKNDDDVSKNSRQIESHMHKIKGLAPMMGKEKVGNLAKSLDAVLKKIVSGQRVEGFLEPLSKSVSEMQIAMKEPHDLGAIQEQISDISSKYVD